MLCTYVDLVQRSGVPIERLIEAVGAGELVLTSYLVDDEDPANVAALRRLRVELAGAADEPKEQAQTTTEKSKPRSYGRGRKAKG